ncbi:hypothetical protein GCM10027596_30740 [Nocardioides korecus]
MQHDAAWARRAQRELRDLLNEWDPIGVLGPGRGGPVDEYDCIRDPLISHLLRGDTEHEVAEFLRAELTDHFGLDQSLVTQGVVDRIFRWWEGVVSTSRRAGSDPTRPGDPRSARRCRPDPR